MSRMKSIFAIAVVIAAAGAVQTANAQATYKILIVGASGSFNAVAVGAYNGGKCPTGAVGTCGAASIGNAGEVSLLDTRPPSKGGSNVTDANATIWLVWDHAAASCSPSCNVWAYVKVDSVVGNRCFFAVPRCQVQIPVVPAHGENKVPIVTGAWPNEAGIPIPPNVVTLLTTNTHVNAAASEVRPEDASFANCRVNSSLGGGNDGLAGLGYNTNNASGVCPTFATSGSIGPYVGTDLTDAAGTQAHPIAFNIAGTDPITNSAIPGFTTVDLGAVPVIFIVDHEDPAGLGSVSNVTIDQLQKVFSGASCAASDLGGGADPLNVYQREPLSGTMQAAEYTVFRLPRDASGNYDIANGASQETGIGGAAVVTNKPCGGAGGNRTREVGNGDETTGILTSFSGNGNDGIGYMFFSYANVAKFAAAASSAKFRYLAVNGVDPVFQVYNTTYDPAQPAGAGTLPGAAGLPASCGTAGSFPCAETHIWKGLWSFPNIRNGSYRHWIMIRLIAATGSSFLTTAQQLATTTQAGVVAQTPDFVPALETITTDPNGGATIDDPGLKLRHSHYTQNSPGYTHTPHNRTDAGGTEAGGDVGGCLTINASTAVSLVYREKTNCTVGP